MRSRLRGGHHLKSNLYRDEALNEMSGFHERRRYAYTQELHDSVEDFLPWLSFYIRNFVIKHEIHD